MLDPIHDAIDFLIHINDQPIESLVNIKLGRVGQVLCASPDYLQSHSAPLHPNDLKDHACICLGENATDNRWKFINHNLHATVQVSGPYLVNHSEMRRDAIKQGFGIGSLPDYIAQQALETGQLIALLTDWKLQGNYKVTTMEISAYSFHKQNTCRIKIGYSLILSKENCYKNKIYRKL